MTSDNKIERAEKYQKRFLVYFQDYLKSIEVEEISLFYLENKNTLLMDLKGKSYVIAKSLNELEHKLDPEKFFRINRSLIISFSGIDRIEPYFGGRLILSFKNISKSKAIVSREKVPDFKLWLDK